MNSGMIITIVILLTVCITPFVLINSRTKQKEKHLKKTLQQHILKNRATLVDYVIHNDFALGLDSLNKIYRYQKTNDKELLQEIDLNYIKSCEVKKDTNRIKNDSSSYEVVQRIALVFTTKNGSKVEQFELYNENKSSQLNGEIALAATWKQKASNLL
ncbi:MAG: hypothetical protein ABJF08_00320 [Nonlabens sp.]